MFLDPVVFIKIDLNNDKFLDQQVAYLNHHVMSGSQFDIYYSRWLFFSTICTSKSN